MTQSPLRAADRQELHAADRHGLHVAIIMDGNGRWAREHGRPREWGHREGAKAVRRVVEASPDLGIDVLTLYAFSSDNWQRPEREVRLLMKLFRRYLKSEIAELKAEGVRLQVIGRRDRLAPDLVQLIEEPRPARVRRARGRSRRGPRPSIALFVARPSDAYGRGRARCRPPDPNGR